MIGARTSSKLRMSINRLLICGLGNPGPKYKNTRHSIGLLFLDHLRTHLRYPAFQPDPHTQGEWSNPTAEYVLFKSSRYMNLSGRSVEGAYRKVGGRGWGALSVVHDDLEVALGEFKVRQSGRGKGHNGIASCIECLRTEEFMRIGIGIGRPESRESSEVSRYVLSDFLPNEMDLMRTRTFPEVIARLGRLVEEGV